MNKNNKKKVVSAIMLGIAGAAVAPIASAELYVSPVLRSTVTIDEPVKVAPKSEPASVTVAVAETGDVAATAVVVKKEAEKAPSKVSGESSVHGRFVMQEKSEKAVNPYGYGKNVPLFVALEKVVPEDEKWIVHIDDGLENSVVNWEGGDSWESVLKTISDQNNVHIIVNTEEQAIGVSKSEKIAFNLAKEIPQVWRLETGKSLRYNLDKWAQKSGWSLEWDHGLNVDYMVEHGAVLTGEFVGPNGVVAKVLKSMESRDKPLKAKFYKANNVLLIQEAGFEQQVRY